MVLHKTLHKNIEHEHKNVYDQWKCHKIGYEVFVIPKSFLVF